MKNSPYKALIFDLDGTLLDSLSDILTAINDMLEKFNLKQISYEENMQMIGDGAYKMVERATNMVGGDVDEHLECYLKNYEKTCNNTKPFEGINELIAELQAKNIKLAVLTNKPQKDAEVIVKRVFGNAFEIIIGQSDVYPPKPDTKGINAIVDKFNLDKADILYLGDGEMDFLTPHNAGIDVINCLWGYRTKEQLVHVGAYRFVDEPFEVTKYF